LSAPKRRPDAGIQRSVGPERCHLWVSLLRTLVLASLALGSRLTDEQHRAWDWGQPRRRSWKSDLNGFVADVFVAGPYLVEDGFIMIRW